MLKVALINWGDFQECGGIQRGQEKLSDFHNYCRGGLQQTDILHREVRESALVDLDNIIPDMPMTMDSSIFLSENDPQEETLTLRLTIPPKQLMQQL